MWRIRSKLVELFLEPRLELVGRDRHARMAADRELKHASIIEPTRAPSHGYQPPSRAAQVGHSGGRWCLGRMAPARPTASIEGDHPEAIPSLTSTEPQSPLAIPPCDREGRLPVVAPVMLLALTRAVWVLVIAIASIFVALAVLAGAFGAAVADSDEPAPGEPPARRRTRAGHSSGGPRARHPAGRARPQGSVAVSEQSDSLPWASATSLPRRDQFSGGSTALSARSTRWRWPICSGPRSGGMSSSRTSTLSSNSRACSRQGE